MVKMSISFLSYAIIRIFYTPVKGFSSISASCKKPRRETLEKFGGYCKEKMGIFVFVTHSIASTPSVNFGKMTKKL